MFLCTACNGGKDTSQKESNHTYVIERKLRRKHGHNLGVYLQCNGGNFRITYAQLLLQKRRSLHSSSERKLWRSWLRQCATGRKVTDSSPDGGIRIFHWHNYSARIMVLGSTQPLTEMSKCKAIPLKAWTGPSRHMKVERLSTLTTRRLYPPENIPGTHFC
jgi:hypothetical protein